MLHISAQTSNNTQYAAIRCSIYAYTYEYINCTYVCALYACRVQCCTSMIHSLKRLFTQRFVFPWSIAGTPMMWRSVMQTHTLETPKSFPFRLQEKIIKLSLMQHHFFLLSLPLSLSPTPSLFRKIIEVISVVV